MAAASDDTMLQADLSSKRAGTNLALGKFDDAKADALASLTGASADWKSYVIAGRAAYGLRDYQTSHDHLQRALDLNPGASSVKRELERCEARLGEASHGEYDFRKMYEALSPRSVHVDCASFTSRTQIADSKLHGRGLFAREKIKAGELVFCEKSLIMPNQYEPSRASAALYAMMVRQLIENPTLAASILRLDGGSHARTGQEGTIVDGAPVVDVWLAEAIRRRNCFSAPLSTRDETRPRPGAASVSQTKGLWPHASHMNHSCVPNTVRSFLGDVLVSRALRDIEAGEELLQSYANIKAQYGRRQAEFRGWGFECTCELCGCEARSTEDRAARRVQLLAQIEKLANKKPPKGMLPEATIRSMEKMTRELEEGHEDEVYDGIPRLMLIYPTMWLLEAYKGRNNHAKVVATASRVLRNFGFKTEDEDVLACLRGGREMPSVLTIHVVTALRDAAHAYASLGKTDESSQFEDVARRAYMLLTGFEDDLSLLEGA